MVHTSGTSHRQARSGAADGRHRALGKRLRGKTSERTTRALTAYPYNLTETHNLALESSPLYVPVAELTQEGFSGTVTELHARLSSMMSEGVRRSVRWPKAPNALGNALRRMANNLRTAGIEIQFSRADLRGRRVVSLVTASELRKRSSVTVSDCH
jgi:hypothetical protein